MQSMTIRKVDRSLLEKAEQAFRPHRITPTTTKEQIMFDAGAKAVLDFMDAELAAVPVDKVGQPEEGSTDHSFEARLRRAYKGTNA